MILTQRSNSFQSPRSNSFQSNCAGDKIEECTDDPFKVGKEQSQRIKEHHTKEYSNAAIELARLQVLYLSIPKFGNISMPL